ncbi:MAG: hypothetical protein ACE5EX_07645 [Phycisphaerae bacterium]
MTTAPRMLRLFLPCLATVMLAHQGCAATHESRIVQAGPGIAIECQRCYDLALNFQRDAGKPRLWTRSRSRAWHMCDGCKAHIELYTLDGKPMIRCPQCAPAGQACEKCRPPPPTEDVQDTGGRG